jgi:hypothetical protein
MLTDSKEATVKSSIPKIYNPNRGIHSLDILAAVIGQGRIMIPEIYDELLHKLMRRTMKDEVRWKLSSRGDMFSLKFRKYSLSMTRGLNHIHFIMSDHNDKGIDEFRISNTDKDWDKIVTFWNQIKMKSPEINNAIKAMIEELEIEEVVGSKDVDSHSEGSHKIYKIAG